VIYLEIAAVILGLLVVCALIYQMLGVRADALRFPAPGRLVEVDQYKLHLYELGCGSPTVVLESGISASSLNWRRVQSDIAKFTRVCSYDRAGLGWSEPCDQPCTPSSLAVQLHSMLHTANIPAPYVLVGHSFGGLIVRAFARQFPGETLGLVMVDALDPAEWSPLTDEQRRTIAHGIRLARRGALAAKLGIVRFCLNLLLAGKSFIPGAMSKTWSGRASVVTDRIATQVAKMPQETWPLVASHWMQPKSFEAMARHFECLTQSISEMEQAPTLDVAVTMLIGGQNEHPTDQLEYAARISSHTNLIVAEESGHWIQLDEPDLIVSSIRKMISDRRDAQYV